MKIDIRAKKNGPRNVPQFGAWDNNVRDGGNGGYTVEFSKARANKQHQPKNGLDARHELKNDKEFQHQQQKNGTDAHHGLKNNDKKIQHHQQKHGLDAHHGLKNNKESPHQQQKNSLDARHGMKNDKKSLHQQQKNDLGTRHGLKNNQEFHHHQHKNGVGAHHGLTNDLEFPGKKQDDPSNMKNGYRSVPQFGMWDQQAAGGGAASYTVEFSKARVNRKQHKNNDLLARPPSIDHEQEALRKQHEDSCMRKKNMLTYLNCCIRP
ncbi:uncharacterized protein LOC129895551 [Solanum dulcamara]|uniref:uncharacterized protein LOC129895551 n=1 Tax=Solanum dulcamara TaxID=45834 RepID=UPI00248617C4|nr:uncharacterized protein LOC129895551 [Solanum dulcamara]